jgi:hypothetical protein
MYKSFLSKVGEAIVVLKSLEYSYWFIIPVLKVLNQSN